MPSTSDFLKEDAMKVCLLILFLSLAGPILAAGDAASQTDRPHPSIGRPAPSFELKTLDGKKISSESLRGRWLVLLFGASWCPYTNGKVTDLNGFYRDYTAHGADFYFIDVAEKKDKLEKWASRKQIVCPVLWDKKGKVSEAFAAPELFPEFQPRREVVISSSFLIDPEGTIRYVEYCTPQGCASRDLSKVRTELDRLMASR